MFYGLAAMVAFLGIASWHIPLPFRETDTVFGHLMDIADNAA